MTRLLLLVIIINITQCGYYYSQANIICVFCLSVDQYANQTKQNITKRELAGLTVGQHILAQHSFLRDFYKFVILYELLCSRLMIFKQMSLKIICSEDFEAADHRRSKRNSWPCDVSSEGHAIISNITIKLQY